jgi:hypothetical protein
MYCIRNSQLATLLLSAGDNARAFGEPRRREFSHGTPV